MHECEYCGDERCTKRACLDALLANAAYYDAEIGYRNTLAANDKTRLELEQAEVMKRNFASSQKQRLRGTTQPR